MIRVKTIHGNFHNIYSRDYADALDGKKKIVRDCETGNLIHINNIIPRCLLSEADQALCDSVQS